MALFKIYRGDSDALPGGSNPLDPANLHDGYAYFCADTGEFFIDVDLAEDGTLLKRVQVNALAAKKLSDGTTTIEIDDIALISNIIDVQHGGTGRNSLTMNAVLVGNGTDTVKLIPADIGAFFVETKNGQPKFGVLPVGQGGIGTNTLANGGILKGNGTGAVTALTGTGALYAATSGAPQFGNLPLTMGGTGGNSAASARNNLSVYSKAEMDQAIANSTTVAYSTTLESAEWATDPAGGFVYTYSNTSLRCGKNHDVPPEVTFTSNREEYNKIDYAMAEAGVGIKFYIEKRPANDIGIIVIDQL